MKTLVTHPFKKNQKRMKYVGMLAVALLLQQTYAQAQLIVYEPFDYPIGSIANNPGEGVGRNGGDGLPATNNGGSPSGTGVGLRIGAYQPSAEVVAGLTYPDLVTKGGAHLITNAFWGSDMYLYQRMPVDPFEQYRFGGNDMGLDGQPLYISFLANTNTNTVASFRVKLGGGNRNLFIFNTGTKWTIQDNDNGPIAESTATLEINTTTLLVLKLDFNPGANDVISLYKNPPIGGTLPASPDASLLISGDYHTGGFNTNPSVASAMRMDEFRMGTTYESVTPKAATVPVRLSSAFTAQADGNRAKLTWSTASESNNDYFTLERSSDGVNYTVLRKKSSGGDASSYVVYDNTPASGTNYYRLSQTDKDAKSEVLGLVSLKFALSSAASLSVYPNPTTDKIVVNLDNYAQAVSITLVDQTGKQVYAEKVSGGLNNYQLKLNKKLASGVYILNLNGEGLNEVKKVIVQ